MANELQITMSANLANGTLKDSFQPGTVQVTQNAKGEFAITASVGTSEQDLTVPSDLVTLGYAFLRNLDAANFVEYGPKSAGVMVPFGKLKAGEVACVRLFPGITIRWKADTAPVQVQIKILND
jgi:hypothetical protein